jgi:hypothetical protein
VAGILEVDPHSVLLAEQGIHVTDEGVARARQKLRDADERKTPEAWARIDEIFGLKQPAA